LNLLAGTTRLPWWPCSPGLAKNFPYFDYKKTCRRW